MSKKFSKGGVSVFVVAIVAVIIGVMALSFARLMSRDQQMSSLQDLSQSAYDSAQAGVEDAKRALANLQKLCASVNPVDKNQCAKLSDILRDSSNQSCRILAEKFNIGDKNSAETPIQTTNNSNDSKLHQAYTCVKINTVSDDFVGEIAPGQSKIIRLKSDRLVKKIRLSWFSQKHSGGSEIDLVDGNKTMTNMLPDSSGWPKNRPSLLRAQLIFAKNSPESTRQSTVFLYPTKNAATSPSDGNTSLIAMNFSNNNFAENALSSVRCHKSLSSAGYGGYACSSTLELEEAASPDSVLRLSAQYNATDYRVEIFDENGNRIKFDGVQAVVDSTGRANDRFRRVQARLEASYNSIPAPEFSVATEGDFCKVMTVRDSTKSSTADCR